MKRPETAQEFVREILASEEYRGALRERLVAGKCTAGELQIAGKLGLQPADEAADERAREATRRMPKYMRKILMRLLRVASGAAPVPAAREISGLGGGILFESEAETGAGARNADAVQEQIQQDTEAAPTTEPMSPDEADLMPQAWPRT